LGAISNWQLANAKPVHHGGTEKKRKAEGLPLIGADEHGSELKLSLQRRGGAEKNKKIGRELTRKARIGKARGLP
jgi:hypothetical protein